jgi:cellulose synthase/poly-beta-1,6-N-acetylglucosamine synthase-like glycosyltransferase
VNVEYSIIILDILLWIIIAANVMYILFFALASLLPQKNKTSNLKTQNSKFLVLFPAYHEDAVIINSVKSFLQQDYPKELYQVVVISDNMTQDTNEQLSELPITLLQPTFEQSSKAKALQFAISHNENSNLKTQTSNYVVILDADNIVAPNFLSQLSRIARPGITIQCHRTAKNADNDIAALDGLSEEINNSIFRKGHNRIGMSSALIGSGMCFNYEWFKNHVCMLESAVEDRELEALLMKQGIYIHYAEDILVMDEKVSSTDNFQRQRLRWMTGQVQAFLQMLPCLPKAIITGNINYIDKTIQQALIPRSILLVLTPILCFIATLTSSIYHLPSIIYHLKWWFTLALFIIGLYIAIPSQLRTKVVLKKTTILPSLVWRMAKNILHIRTNNKDFIHTTHGK